VPKAVELHQAALAEANAATAWYAKRDPVVAEAFAAELKEALQRVRQGPDRWPVDVAATRRVLLRRFPFKIVYTVEHDRVLVVAVAHTRRRPGYWADRT
jgi:plasmid stabilization system protein ParE